MILITSIIAGPLLCIIVFFSAPIKIKIGYFPMVFFVRWHFVKFQVDYQKQLQTNLWVFKKKINFKKKKTKKAPLKEDSKPKPESNTKEKAEESKKKKKLSFNEVIEITKQEEIKKIFFLTLQLTLKIKNSFKIKKLKWDVSLQDVFIQGQICWFFSYFPTTKQIQLNSNFENKNNLDFTIHISMVKLISAFIVFLILFPYLKAYKTYKKLK